MALLPKTYPKVKLSSALWVVLALCLSPSLRPAHAYLDAGTGSYIIQVSIGVIFGGVYAFKRAIGGAFQKLRGRGNKTESKKEA